jgi:glutaconyl-CoA/methylmalonyl-CoA decarboxylase subunit gamma
MKKYLVKVNGNQYEVEVEEVGGAAPATAPAATAAAPAAPRAAAAPAGAAVVQAPMPGTILKVNVGVGDTVKKGQVLIILEAMKMENEIVAPGDGKVASVNVSKGSSVNAGDVLVSME